MSPEHFSTILLGHPTNLSCQYDKHIKIQESYHILRYGPIKEAPLWGKIIIKISHLLITLSSALNIIIYSYKVGLVDFYMHNHHK